MRNETSGEFPIMHRAETPEQPVEVEIDLQKLKHRLDGVSSILTPEDKRVLQLMLDKLSQSLEPNQEENIDVDIFEKLDYLLKIFEQQLSLDQQKKALISSVDSEKIGLELELKNAYNQLVVEIKEKLSKIKGAEAKAKYTSFLLGLNDLKTQNLQEAIAYAEDILHMIQVDLISQDLPKPTGHIDEFDIANMPDNFLELPNLGNVTAPNLERKTKNASVS